MSAVWVWTGSESALRDESEEAEVEVQGRAGQTRYGAMNQTNEVERACISEVNVREFII